jgi:4-amino-4-deoxy-L-arabinose transferase-like glycosyltransferase
MALRTRPGRPQAADPITAVPQTGRAGRRSGLILALALVAYAVLAVGYALHTPIWQNPDEPAHVNYVRFVALTRTLPELRPGDWDSALLSRLQNGRLQAGDSVESIRYESWQPPGYYLLASPAYVLGPSSDDAAVQRLRLLNVVLGGLTLVVGYFAARKLVPESLALAVPFAIAGIPMFTAVSASVSADPLANLLAALLLLALLRQTDWRVVGVLLGVGLLTKLALAIFVPLVLWRCWRALVLAGVITVPWLLHQVTTYGWTDPLALARHAQVVADQPRFPGLTLDYAVDFLRVSFHSFWAQFGWMAIPAPDRLYWTWGALCLLAVAGLLVRPLPLRSCGWQLVLATVVLAALAYVTYNLTFQQFQARYVFPALVPICLLLARGWSALSPRRWPLLVPYALSAVLLALNAYALTRVLVPGFGVGD